MEAPTLQSFHANEMMVLSHSYLVKANFFLLLLQNLPLDVRDWKTLVKTTQVSDLSQSQASAYSLPENIVRFEPRLPASRSAVVWLPPARRLFPCTNTSLGVGFRHLTKHYLCVE